eukprot:m.275211 g.275211  ORF g.275211 m.275211 type:complete len:436 (-) comp116861_c0_seq1:75-1382(-)
MRFGKHLRQHIDSTAADDSHYVDYSTMKKAIKRGCTEEEFQSLYYDELRRVTNGLQAGAQTQDPVFTEINMVALDKISKKFDKKFASDIRQENSKLSSVIVGTTLENYTAAKNEPGTVSQTVNFMAGGTSGIVSRCCTAPLDRVKIVMQVGAGNASSRNILSTFKYIYKDGGFFGFWRGNFANVLKVVPESAIKFMVYDHAKGVVCVDQRQVTIAERFQAGCIAGAVSQTAIYPLDVTKTRLAASTTGTYRGILHCMTSTLRQDGFRAFYRGLGAALIAVVPAAGVDLAAYNTLRAWYVERASRQYFDELVRLTQNVIDSDNVEEKHRKMAEKLALPARSPPIWVSLIFGATSATSGALVAYPLTLIRTKLITEGMPGVPKRYGGSISGVISVIMQEQGFRGFYRGLIPALLKTVPAISIGYGAFEVSKRFLHSF